MKLLILYRIHGLGLEGFDLLKELNLRWKSYLGLPTGRLYFNTFHLKKIYIFNMVGCSKNLLQMVVHDGLSKLFLKLPVLESSFSFPIKNG